MKVLLSIGIMSTLMITPTLVKADTKNNETLSKDTREITKVSHGSEHLIKSPDNNVPKGYKINNSTQSDSKEGLYSKLFDSKNVQEVNININENNFNYLLQNAINKPYVLADSLTIKNEKICNVGIKTYGDSSLKDVWNSDSNKFSFEVNTSKFINKKDYGDNQNFYGIERISLNNIYGDPTLMKQFLSYELMTKMGVPTPLYSLIKLNINGRFYGIYNMTEQLSSTSIKRIMSNNDGDLYKCKSPGGSLIYNKDALDSLINNGRYKFDIASYKDKNNALSSYTGILGNKVYGTSINNCAGKEDNVNKDCNELFSWMKKLNILNNSENPNTKSYKSQVESILDVDEVLKYFAVNTYVVNLDSYQSKQQDNYYMYLMDGKGTILPMDYNYAFGGGRGKKVLDIINFSIDNPVLDTTLKERPLLNVLLQNDDYKAKYKSYLSDCTKIASLGGTVDGVDYKKDNFNNEIDNYKKLLDDSVKNDHNAFFAFDEYTKAIDDLKTLNTKRAEAVSNQIKDDFTKVSDDGISLNSLENAKLIAPLAFAPDNIPSSGNDDTTNGENKSGNTEDNSKKDGDTSKENSTDNKDESNNTDDNENLNEDNNNDSSSQDNTDNNSWDQNNTDGKPSDDYDDSKFGGIFKTSDKNNIFIYLIIITLSIGSMVYILRKKQRKL